MSDVGARQNGKKHPVQTDEDEQAWHDAVSMFVEKANELQLKEGLDVRLVSTAMLFAAVHYNVFEITEGGTLPQDITGLTSNKLYAEIVSVISKNNDHLIPPELVH